MVNGPSHVDLVPQSAAFGLRGVRVTDVSLEFVEPPTFERWEGVGETLKRIERAAQWWLGDWMNFGEGAYGETYSQALDAGFPYQTAANCAWVARTFEVSRRRKSLPFAFHAEVCEFDPDIQDELLDLAEAERWTRNDLRGELRRRKGLEASDGRERWRRLMQLLDDIDPEMFRQDERRVMASLLRGWADRADPPVPEALFDVPARKPDWA